MSKQVSQRHPRLSVNVLSVDPNTYTVSKYELTMRTPIALATKTRAVHPDVLMVQTHKDIAEVAGWFQMRLVARRDASHKTWANIIKPGDYVEIRLANQWTVSAKDETLVMRGFVDSCTEQKGVGQDGSPDTYIEISGRDYGKLLLRALFLLYPQNNKYGVAYGSHLTDWATPELELFKMPLAMTEPSDFVNTIMRLVTGAGADGKASGIMPIPQGAPPFKISIGNSLNAYRIVNPTEAPYTGSVWNLLNYYQNAPFWEMFVTDDTSQAGEGAPTGDSGLTPQFVWRRSPYLNKDGKVAATDADTNLIFPDVTISLMDVVTMRLTRDDQQAYSYFLCIPRIDNSGDEEWWQMFSPPQSDGGSAIWDQTITRWLGFAPLECPLNIAPSSIVDPATAQETQTKADLTGGFKQTADTLSQWLADVYTRNYLYESGTLTVKGNPAIRIGRHLILKETKQKLYIEAVDHTFTADPLGFQTNVTVTRGEHPGAYEVIDDSQDLGLGTVATNGPSQTPPPSQPPTTTPPASKCKWTNPVPGSVCTQAFGPTSNTAEPIVNGQHFHMGIDLSNTGGSGEGPAVLAPTAGIVIAASDNGLSNAGQAGGQTGLGNWIAIRTVGSDCEGVIILGHLTTGTFKVHTGDVVNAGDVLANEGNSGASAGTHTHVEFHPGANTATQNSAHQVSSDTGAADPGPYIGISC